MNENSDFERFRVDFQYWCQKCVKIRDKITGQRIPFILNAPQKKLLAVMESQRLAGKPIRIILLKARQWGGSTLVQIYIAWHQIILYKGRNSAIIGHKRNSSYSVKQMLRDVIENYPEYYQEDLDNPLKLKNVTESVNVQEIPCRDSKIIISSSYSPDALRSFPLHYAHLTEVAFWQATRSVDPSDIIRSTAGTIPLEPGTIIVMESTANGANSFFYNEWIRAINGQSIYTPVFVAWNEIEFYKTDYKKGIVFSQYENELINKGFEKESVTWYHEKLKEYPEQKMMMAEFPSSWEEAFVTSTHYVFSQGEQESIIARSKDPIFNDNNLRIWSNVTFNRSSYKSNYVAVLTLGSSIAEERDTILSIWNIDNNRLDLSAQLVEKIPINLIATRILPILHQYNDALLLIAELKFEDKVFERSLADFVIEDLKSYRNIYRHNGKKIIPIDRDLYSLMFYELIVNERNDLFTDKDISSAKSISTMIVHDNQKFYISYDNDFKLVINRAVVVYFWRMINLHAFKKINEQDKKILLYG